MYLAYRELPPDAASSIPDPSEFAAALAAFFDLANEKYSESSWFQAQEHGSRYQRMLAYGTGYLGISGGLPWCYGYRDFVHGDVTMIGPYQLLNVPGRNESWQGDEYIIAPETRTSDAVPAISLEWLPELPIAGQPATFEQLAAVLGQRFPGSSLLPPGVDLNPNVEPGTGWMGLYELPAGSSDPRSGMLAVVSPQSNEGGLIIDVWRGEPGPVGPAPPATLPPEVLEILGEDLGGVYQVVTRLCGPDNSADLTEPHWNMACLDEQ
jgi:hypothetical protein